MCSLSTTDMRNKSINEHKGECELLENIHNLKKEEIQHMGIAKYLKKKKNHELVHLYWLKSA